jgi:hypothetical protein
MEKAEDRAGIAKFLYERFMERYLVPLKEVGKGYENGFLVMASCCLLIESLMAFREGWPSTEGLSQRAFELFFKAEAEFAVFRGQGVDFWKGVRCGILHQGETALGWRLNFTDKAAPLLEALEKRVNCFKFMDALEKVLSDYRALLESTPWKYEQWQNVRKKMAATINGCES